MRTRHCYKFFTESKVVMSKDLLLDLLRRSAKRVVRAEYADGAFESSRGFAPPRFRANNDPLMIQDSRVSRYSISSRIHGRNDDNPVTGRLTKIQISLCSRAEWPTSFVRCITTFGITYVTHATSSFTRFFLAGRVSIMLT